MNQLINMHYSNKKAGIFLATFLWILCLYFILKCKSPLKQLEYGPEMDDIKKTIASQDKNIISIDKNITKETKMVMTRLRNSQIKVKFTNLQYNTTALLTKDEQLPDPKHEFVPYNHNGVQTHKYVCFEEISLFSGIAIDENHVALQKKIVIYGADKEGEDVLKVATSDSCDKPNDWPVTFRKRKVPDDYIILPYPAYFVTASQPGNLYHLLHDTLVGLYGILKQTNRLNSTVKNQVYTRKPFIPFFQPRSKNISTYGVLIRALGVRSFPVYHAAPPKVCHM